MIVSLGNWRGETGTRLHMPLERSSNGAVDLLLLVEDEPLIAEMLAESLKDGGYGVLVQSTGKGAMAALERSSNKLSGLITDVRLPDRIFGWEIARRARELSPALPIVYMTGNSGADWAAQGVSKSVLVQKPFAPARIISAISGLLVEHDSALQ